MLSMRRYQDHRLRTQPKFSAQPQQHSIQKLALQGRWYRKTKKLAASTDHPESNVITERIKQQFEQRASTYDQDNGYHPSLAQQLLQMCDLQHGQRLLDLGSGTGMLAIPAAAIVGTDGHVVALDLSKAMLEQAKAKAEAQRLDSVMEFVVGDMENLEKYLPGQQGSFDVITCSAAVPFLQDLFQALVSWKSWLAPGGKLAFNAFVAPAIEEFATFRRLAAQYGFGNLKDPCDALGSEQLVTEAMQAAGYICIEVRAEHRERSMPATSPEEHAEKVWHTALHRNPFTTLSGEDMQELHDAYIAAAVKELDSSGRYNAQQKHVVNRHTVLYALGSV